MPATRTSSPPACCAIRAALRLAVRLSAILATLGAAAPAGSSWAADVPPEDARQAFLVEVPLPIRGDVDDRVKATASRVLEGLPKSGPRPALIFEFRPRAGESGAGSEFERSLSLANYFSGPAFRDVETIAWLPESVTGHAVLPALACEKIVMHPDAELGDAGRDEEHVDELMLNAYQSIAARSGAVDPPVAAAMVDRSVALFQVKMLNGDERFVRAEEQRRLTDAGELVSSKEVVPAGQFARFRGYELRNDLHFVSHLASDRKELAEVLRLRPGGIDENPSLGRGWKAVQVKLEGPIDGRTVEWLMASLEEARGEGANLAFIRIDSGGGSPADSASLANYLARLKPAEIRTVAFVPVEAARDAALVAAACDHLVMGKDAVIGGASIEGVSADSLKSTARAIAKAKHRDWSLIAALVDPELKVYRYKRESGQARYLTEEELKGLDHAELWRQEAELSTADGLSGQRAERVGLARYLADDYTQVLALYHIPDEPRSLEPNWAHSGVEAFARVLSSPWLAHLLILIAFYMLIAELQHPGIGVPGFISLTCFVLFFWSQFLSGSANWLEILLFATGVICLLLEIFVIPGFGIFGVGGIVMILLSVVLASQTFIIPTTREELAALPYSLSTLFTAALGVCLSLVLVRYFLPKTPLGRRLILAGPSGEEAVEQNRRESLAHWEHLLGRRGRTTTPLLPAGKVDFGEETVAVVSEGGHIDRGAEVVVLEVIGNRVVVRAVDED